MEQKIRIEEVIRETADAITLRFERHPLLAGYTPGQFVNITWALGGEKVSRSYSFSSAPGMDHLPAVTIKRVPGGKLSGKLVDTVRPGEVLEVTEPAGRFSLSNNMLVSNMVFVAGGSGITPLFSMIKTVLASERYAATRVTLLYGNQDAESVIFGRALMELEAANAQRFQVVHYLQKGHGSEGANLRYGHITDHELSAFVSAGDGQTEVYLCGPDGMMATVRGQLGRLGFDMSRLHAETFGQLSPAEGTRSDVSVAAPSTVLFQKGDETFSLEVPRDRFILQTGLDSGLPLAHSCKEAMCGSCKVKLVSGAIDMTENYALTNSQLAEGLVLLCSSRPISEKVEVRYV